MIFFDFEVFKYDWLVVLINPENQTEVKIHNNTEALLNYYNDNKNDIWIGYNAVRYDQWILKSILCGFNPKAMNDWIIDKGQSPWSFSDLTRKNYPLLVYDVMTSQHSLKQLEGYLGNSIHESSIDFNIKRLLTEDEINSTFDYCYSDVCNTIDVFLERIDDFNAHMDLIKTFKLHISNISKTKAQLSALILECTKTTRDDEWDITIVPTLKLSKYDYVRKWFLDNKGDYTKNLTTNIAGVSHVFGWGGLHGALEKYYGTGLLIHIDVRSYYPSLMIAYKFLTRNSRNPNKYKEIYDKRVELKAQGKKKEQAPYKIVLNSTYGICKDKFNPAYDALQANNVTVNGQLLLLDLIEKLEAIDGFQLIQSNTDGLIIKVPNTDYHFNQVDDICYEWETRTGMNLEFDFIEKIYQKDVNNYVFRFENGKLERKGGYVKESSKLDNDLPIVNTALVNYMMYNIPVEKTINECNDLIQFQKIVRVSSKYEFGAIGYEFKDDKPTKVCKYDNGGGWCTVSGKRCPYKQPSRAKCFSAVMTYKQSKPIKMLTDKTFRVFASNDLEDGYIGKLKSADSTCEKFANTPDRMFILNGDINDVDIPNRLNRQWYIDLAKKRLGDFGVI